MTCSHGDISSEVCAFRARHCGFTEVELREEKGEERAAWGSEKARALSKEYLFQTWTPGSFGPWDSDTWRKGTEICPKKGDGGGRHPGPRGRGLPLPSWAPPCGLQPVPDPWSPPGGHSEPSRNLRQGWLQALLPEQMHVQGSGITDLTQAWMGPKMEGVVGTVAKQETTTLSEVAACQLPPH